MKSLSPICAALVAALTASLAAGAMLAQTPAATQIYRYDAHGRLVASSTARTGANGLFASYILDAADNRTALHDSNVSPPPTGGVLEVPDTLLPSQSFKSANGQYEMLLTSSGDLTITGPGVTWSSGTADGRAVMARVSSSGRFEILGPNLSAIWTTPNAASPGAKLTLENTGKAALRTSAGATLWCSAAPCP